MGKVKSVVDTILGEALAGNFNDMLGIASVIDNRARATNVTHKDVVSAPGQFDAYGKSLPPGVGRYRDLAQKAIDQVRELGPVHNATFYATPAAAKNLPGGLTPVTQTAGHQYFADPKNRSLRTAKGYRRPDPAALETVSVSLPDIGPAPDARPSAPVGSNPSRGVGLAALASPADLARVASNPTPEVGLFDFTPPSGKIRNMDVQPELTSLVESAVSQMGPQYGWDTVSGGQPAKGTSSRRVGSVRHDFGRAIDGTLTLDGRAIDPVNNRQDYMNALTNLAEVGVGGLGHYGWGIHADLMSPNTWGPTTSRRSLDPGFGLAIDQGRALSSLGGNYPTPTPSPISQTGFSAPVNPVERTALASLMGISEPAPAMPGRSRVAPSSPPSINNGFAGPQVRTAVRDMTPQISMPDQAPRFAGAASRNVAAMTPEISMPAAGPKFSTPAQVSAPSRSIVSAPTVDQMAAKQRNVEKAASAAASLAPPTDLTTGAAPALAVDQLQQAPIPGLQRVAPVAAPAAAPVAAQPARVAPPTQVAPPARQVSPQRAAPARRAPTAPAPAPSFSGQDVWSGRAPTGIATNGNQMTRNPDGTVSMTSSKYGYTETMNPDGSYRSTTAPGVFGLDAAVNGMFGAPANQVTASVVNQAVAPATNMQAPAIGNLANRGALKGGAVGMMLAGLPGGALGALLGGIRANQQRLAAQQNIFTANFRPGLAYPGAPSGARSQGELTDFGREAARGEHGSQAEHAANNPGGGLW